MRNNGSRTGLGPPDRGPPRRASRARTRLDVAGAGRPPPPAPPGAGTDGRDAEGAEEDEDAADVGVVRSAGVEDASDAAADAGVDRPPVSVPDRAPGMVSPGSGAPSGAFETASGVVVKRLPPCIPFSPWYRGRAGWRGRSGSPPRRPGTKSGNHTVNSVFTGTSGAA